MSSDFDATEFVDDDFQGRHKASPAVASPVGSRAPTREDVEAKVSQAQQKLADLKRAQEELERERASLEETRRRQIEFQTGRQEMVQHLTRGVVLLEEAQMAARRDADEMTKSLAEMRDALAKVEATREENWTRENFAVELTRGLTTIENARMEWNAARLKYAVLAPQTPGGSPLESAANSSSPDLFKGRDFVELCKLGLALTWPLAVVALLAFCVLFALLMRR